MKNRFDKIFSLVLVLCILLSCSIGKKNIEFNQELADRMKLEVDYIENQMPGPDRDSDPNRYISFMILTDTGKLKHNWKTISLSALSGKEAVLAEEFDNTEFEGKNKTVYRNTTRIKDLSKLGNTIKVSVVLQNEEGERVQLVKEGIEKQVVQ